MLLFVESCAGMAECAPLFRELCWRRIRTAGLEFSVRSVRDG
jgi:hypothetical protein